MAAGYSLGVNDINNKAGQLASAAWDALNDCNQFYRWLTDTAHSDAALVALGVLQADVTLIKTAFADLGSTTNGLWAVSHGLVTVPSVNNFFFSARQLTGTKYTG